MTRQFTIFIAYNRKIWKRGRPEPYVYSYTVMKAAMPSSLEELETLMKMARNEAERLSMRKGWKIPDIMTFSIHRQGFGKGHYKTEFVNVFQVIRVDRKGRILTLTAPRQSINPEAYRIYLEYQRRKALQSMKKEDRDYALAKLMGYRMTRPEVKLGRITKFKDKDPYDVDILDLFDARIKDVEGYFNQDNVDDVRLIKIDIKPIWETNKDRHRIYQKDKTHKPFHFG